MKRLARVIGFIAGVAAIVWAMRDRFISVATSREPQPPRFRRVADTTDELLTVDGIGPVYAERLTDAGIASLALLAEASPDSVAEAASVSAARARDWIGQAASRAQ